ncbi:unnamed protein product [Penicillium olsonii]|nr:unnamed protein product [Penicillium olsonii]
MPECLRSLRFDELSARRDRVEQAIAGTGKWLANDEAFQNWEKSPHSSLLLIRGKPGSGKSTLAKHILEMKKLEHKMSQPGELDPYNPPRVLIADFFYSLRGGTKETNHTLMLRSLLFQLLSQDASLFLLFQSAYRRLRAKFNFEWPHQELKDIFSSLSSLQYSPAEARIYILLDAMDESSDRGRPEILCLLEEICSSKSDRTFKCLVASRPLPVGEIDHSKWDSIVLEQKNRKDIQSLIQSGLREVKRQPGLSTIDFQFALDYMTKHAEGVFLWVALVFRELNELALTGPSQEELETCLRRLPIELGEFYSLIIQRLVDKSKTNRGLPGLLEKGAKMLAWVVFAERPLKLEEFQDAVAIPSSPGTFDPSPGFLRRTRVSDIQSRINACCGPLIEIREGFVQLLHLSVREYLLLPGGAGPPFHVTQERGDAEISSCCIRYLCLIACQPQSKAITSWDNQYYDELVEWLAGFPLLSYILRYLLSSLRFACASTVSTEISLLSQLLRDNHASLSLLGHRLKTLPKFGHLDLKPALNYPQFHYRCLTSAVERQLPAVVEVIILLKEGILKGDFELLQRASCNDYADVVIMLLHHGADLNAQGGHYGNALQAATVNGHGSMARFMIDNGADLNAQGGYYGNALQAASVNGYADVVRMLLDQGADPNAQGGHYGNALQAATSNGHSDVIQILVDHGAALP